MRFDILNPEERRAALGLQVAKAKLRIEMAEALLDGAKAEYDLMINKRERNDMLDADDGAVRNYTHIDAAISRHQLVLTSSEGIVRRINGRIEALDAQIAEVVRGATHRVFTEIVGEAPGEHIELRGAGTFKFSPEDVSCRYVLIFDVTTGIREIVTDAPHELKDRLIQLLDTDDSSRASTPGTD